MTSSPSISRRGWLGGSTAALAAMASPAFGFSAQATTGRQPATPIPSDAERFALPHPSGTGFFQITVSRKADIQPGTKDVPVLFVLDGDMMFGAAAEIARLRGTGGHAPTAMVVGIGYGAQYAEMAKLRTADLTPPLSEAGRRAIGGMSDMIGDKDGGAAAFLTFLTDTLVPEILARYPEASPTHRILFGHSLGGLFTSYALLTRPDAFTTFLASSPSLWWDGFAVLGHLPVFTKRLTTLKTKPSALICVGGKEQDRPTKTLPGVAMTLEEIAAMVTTARMVDAAAEFAASLQKAGLNDVTHVAFQGEDHATVITPAINRGLAVALPVPV